MRELYLPIIKRTLFMIGKITLTMTLLCFEAVFGLKVNMRKSKLVPVGRVDDI